jgi:hypothetical protein
MECRSSSTYGHAKGSGRAREVRCRTRTSIEGPLRQVVGITGQLTGSRADIIIVDDVEVPKNSFTPAMRERIAMLVKEFDAVLKPGGRILYLGTPQVEESLYNILVRERGYSVRVWPAEIPKRLDVYGGNLAPYIVQADGERGEGRRSHRAHKVLEGGSRLT